MTTYLDSTAEGQRDAALVREAELRKELARRFSLDDEVLREAIADQIAIAEKMKDVLLEDDYKRIPIYRETFLLAADCIISLLRREPAPTRLRVPAGVRILSFKQRVDTRSTIGYELLLGDGILLEQLNRRPDSYLAREEFIDIGVKIDEIGAQRKAAAIKKAMVHSATIEIDHDTLKAFVDDLRNLFDL